MTPKVVLLTGCSSGFGLLTSVQLARRGHRVIATMRDLSKKDPLNEELGRANLKCEILRMDVTDPDGIEAVVLRVLKQYGRVDAVVNNAGFGIGGAFEDLSDAQIRAQMDVNFFGVQNVCRAVLPAMREQREGRLINISSIAGLTAAPCFGAYNASKWALEGFSESLSFEVRPFGIDVCLLEPGTYRTKIFSENARYAARFDDPDSPYFKLNQGLRDRVDRYVAACQRDPVKIAKTVQRLLEHPDPPLRSIPDLEGRAQVWLRAMLPSRLYHKALSRILVRPSQNR